LLRSKLFGGLRFSLLLLTFLNFIIDEKNLVMEFGEELSGLGQSVAFILEDDLVFSVGWILFSFQNFPHFLRKSQFDVLLTGFWEVDGLPLDEALAVVAANVGEGGC